MNRYYCLLDARHCARHWGWHEGCRNELEVLSALEELPSHFLPHHPSNMALAMLLPTIPILLNPVVIAQA